MRLGSEFTPQYCQKEKNSLGIRRSWNTKVRKHTKHRM
jgi:hypothetical protein